MLRSSLHQRGGVGGSNGRFERTRRPALPRIVPRRFAQRKWGASRVVLDHWFVS
jgi:hypothetical protein